ncbi:MAG TPA: CoA ester lyase [Candidatus Micrarchaeia archaeon]|nr:CoA ester lyase [Candidatus Micrarchaeia archaeon]
MRLRRAVLACPGSSPRMMERAAASGADEVFLDLEDAVAPSEKVAARAQVVDALRRHEFGRTIRCVRVNQIGSALVLGDIAEVVRGAAGHLDTLMLPKVQDAGDIAFADRLLTGLEAELGLTRRIGLEAQIEDARGLVNVDAIAAFDRVETVIFGPGDFAASMGLPQLTVGAESAAYPGDLWHYPLFRIVVAARACGKQAIDGPFAAIRDLEGLRRSAERSAALGYDGKWALHPSQLEPVTTAFTPRRADFQRARAILAAHRAAAELDHRGAVMLGDEMIDEASRKMAAQLVARGTAAGLDASADDGTG